MAFLTVLLNVNVPHPHPLEDTATVFSLLFIFIFSLKGLTNDTSVTLSLEETSVPVIFSKAVLVSSGVQRLLQSVILSFFLF